MSDSNTLLSYLPQINAILWTGKLNHIFECNFTSAIVFKDSYLNDTPVTQIRERELVNSTGTRYDKSNYHAPNQRRGAQLLLQSE